MTINDVLRRDYGCSYIEMGHFERFLCQDFVPTVVQRGTQ